VFGGGHAPPSQVTFSSVLAGMMPPSPKSQFHMVGESDDLSVNWTVSGAHPDRGVPSKSATIAFAVTVMYACFTSVSEVPYWFDAVSVTVYVPGSR